MAGYFVVECLIFNGSEWLQESKPSLAKMLEGEAYAPKCLPGAECGLDGLVILALDHQGLHTPVVVRYHMLSHVGVWNCDGGFILIHDKFTGGISMIHNDIYIYPIFGQTRINEIKVFDGTAIGCTAAAVANKRMTMSGKRAPVSAIHPLTDPTVTWRMARSRKRGGAPELSR